MRKNGLECGNKLLKIKLVYQICLICTFLKLCNQLCYTVFNCTFLVQYILGSESRNVNGSSDICDIFWKSFNVYCMIKQKSNYVHFRNQEFQHKRKRN
jgi:hypothetical protein